MVELISRRKCANDGITKKEIKEEEDARRLEERSEEEDERGRTTTRRTGQERSRGQRETEEGEREREKRGTEGKQRKDDEKRKERRNDTEEQAILLQALCDRGGDDGNDWLSYLQSDPVMMLVMLLRSRAAALRHNKPSASDRVRNPGRDVTESDENRVATH